MLNSQKGNMYGFVTHTWNTVKGECKDHDCSYCYMKVGKLNPVRFDEKELKTDLGKDNFIFVGSSNDMWAKSIPEEWINKTLNHCIEFDNTYLFQSKNPHRFLEYVVNGIPFPQKTILGTTIETNRDYNISKAPIVQDRAICLSIMRRKGFQTMLTLEPLLDFDLESMIRLVSIARPEWVNIGADSKGHKLPEPSLEKVNKLIDELNKMTTVKCKNNLGRLLK